MLASDMLRMQEQRWTGLKTKKINENLLKRKRNRKRQKKVMKNYSNFEYLNIPGKEFNVNKFTEQIILFQEKNQYSVTLG